MSCLSGPLAPQNLSLSRVTPNSALITWSRHSTDAPDGFVINVTKGLNTKSRFLPNGKLGSFTIRELNPGHNYYVALSAVKNTGQEQIYSTPQQLAFATRETTFHITKIALCRLLQTLNMSQSLSHDSEAERFLCVSEKVPVQVRPARRERPSVTGQQTPSERPGTSSLMPDPGGPAETENLDDSFRYQPEQNIMSCSFTVRVKHSCPFLQIHRIG